jgi:hypothetical protein
MLDFLLYALLLAIPMAAGAYLENKFGSKLKARVVALEADLAALRAKL